LHSFDFNYRHHIVKPRIQYGLKWDCRHLKHRVQTRCLAQRNWVLLRISQTTRQQIS
jgi:hypothetical protein